MIHIPCILCNLVREQLSDRHKFRICAICRRSVVLFPNITRYPQFVYITLSAVIRCHVEGSFPPLVLGQVVNNLLLPVVVVARFLGTARQQGENDKRQIDI